MAKIFGLTDEEIEGMKDAKAKYVELDYNIEKLIQKVEYQNNDNNKVMLDQDEYKLLLKNALLYKQTLAEYIRECESKINMQNGESKDFRI